jgi:hypothetical protein
MNILIELNLTTLEQFASYGYIDFSNILFSVPNPGYELTVNEVAIIQEDQGTTDDFDFFTNRVWQYTESENFTSSPDPIDDQYQLALGNEPLLYNDSEEGKWLEYLKIYDENYNYYSAGISGDEYQLHYNTTTGNFTWNDSFDKFQDYWGMQIELPSMISANTTLFFEYCVNTSWSSQIDLSYNNFDTYSLDMVYNNEYLLEPRYEKWYDKIIEN